MNYRFLFLLIFILLATSGWPIFVLAGKTDPGVPVLLYHRITKDREVPLDSCCVLPEKNFDEQIDYLYRQGYQTINSTQLYNYITKNKPIPMKSVVLSFDDSYASDYEIVFPTLKKYGYTGVFFAITGDMVKNKKSAGRIKEMAEAKMDIESHTVNHYYLGGGKLSGGVRSLTASVLLADHELWDSRQYLEKALDKKIKFLAWPGDSYNERLVALAKEDGYIGLFMAKPSRTNNIFSSGYNQGQNSFNVYPSDPFYLKRINIDNSVTFEMFKNLMTTGHLVYE